MLRSKSYRIGSSDYIRISNTYVNKQITNISYNGYSNKFSMCTNDGYKWEFEVYYDGSM